MSQEVSSITTPAPHDKWAHILQTTAEALAFHTPAWLDCICEVGNYADASRLYEFRNGRSVLLPLVRRRGLPGKVAVEASLPYGWGFGGALAPGGLTAEEASCIMADLSARPGLITSVRPDPLAAVPWLATRPAAIATTQRLAHVLDLEGGFEHLWEHRFATRARRNVRRAERQGVVVECDTTGRLMPVFYALYWRSVDRWARQAGQPLLLAQLLARWREPFRKYQRIAARLGTACRVYVAWVNGQPAASTIVLHHGSNASYWRAAMDKDLADPSRATFLLLRRSIEDACAGGCRHYHMGDSGNSASLAYFKEGFGAEPYRYEEYHFERLPVTQLVERARNVAARIARLRHAQSDAEETSEATEATHAGLTV
jgi:Acetyltransferase (GNAT) domain